MEALAAGEGDAFRRGESHLRGGVKFDFRADGLGKANKPQILDDEGIDLGSGGQAEEPFRFGKFRRENKNIHREVTTSAPGMEVVHDLGQILLSEVFGPKPGVEGWKPEIDRIRTGRDGRLEAVPVTRGGQKLRCGKHCGYF